MSFENTKRKSEAAISILRDAAELIGERRQEAITLQTTSQSIIPGLGLVDDAASLISRAQSITKGIFQLIVVGEFSHGKSTLLNALIEEDTLFTNILPATAVITMLVHNPNNDEPLQARTYNSDEKVISTYSVKEFRELFRFTKEDTKKALNGELDERFRRIAYAEVESRHPLCANKVRVIDSPGLAHREAMTQLTTRFFKQADAIVFMLDAQRLFVDRERLFLDANFKKQYYPNLFFVINKMDLVAETSKQDIEEFTRLHLELFFKDSNGAFDEDLYNERVFFISAKAALNAVTKESPPNREAYTASGVQDLRDSLMSFLQSDGRNNSIFAATLAHFERVCSSADIYIKRQKKLYNTQVDVLKNGKGRVDIFLKGIRRDAKTSEHIIEDVGDKIKRAYYREFRNFIISLGDSFVDDGGGDISLQDMQDKPSLELALKKKLGNYFRVKLDAWNANEGNDVVQEEIDDLIDQLQDSLALFQLRLREVHSVLEDAKIEQNVDDIDIPDDVYDEANELLEGIIVRPDFSVSLEDDNYSEIFVATLVREVVDFLPEWLGDVVRQFTDWIFGSPEEKIKEELQKALRQFLTKEMDSLNRRDEIYSLIEEEFTVKTKRRLNSALDRQIRVIEQQITDAISRLQSNTFNAEEEKLRLEQIEQVLQTLNNKLHLAVEA